MSTTPTTPASPMYQCDDCGRKSRQMNPDVDKILERVSPGEPFPEGECLKCGGLVHTVENVKKWRRQDRAVAVCEKLARTEPKRYASHEAMAAIVKEAKKALA